MLQIDPGPMYSTLATDPILSEVVQLFVDEMPARTACLRAHFDVQDWDALKRAAHQMKGACGSYGFQDLTSFSALLEAAVGRREPREDRRVARSTRGPMPPSHGRSSAERRASSPLKKSA